MGQSVVESAATVRTVRATLWCKRRRFWRPIGLHPDSKHARENLRDGLKSTLLIQVNRVLDDEWHEPIVNLLLHADGLPEGLTSENLLRGREERGKFPLRESLHDFIACNRFAPVGDGTIGDRAIGLSREELCGKSEIGLESTGNLVAGIPHANLPEIGTRTLPICIDLGASQCSH